MQKKKYKEIYIDADGESTMAGGAWSICFVYSNQGNFILKGYLRECREFLSKAERDRGLKYIVCQSLYHRGRSRDVWDCSDERVHIWDRLLNISIIINHLGEKVKVNGELLSEMIKNGMPIQ